MPTPSAVRVELRPPAKVNLALAVLGRRPDGYHEVRTLLQTVDLADELVLVTGPRPGVVLTCDDPALPTGDDNLVVRAARAFYVAAAVDGGVRVELRKRIPASGGLGGGSSDAAATLIGLNRAHGEPLAVERLAELAAELGSDVPFFLDGGVALAVGRGEEIYPLADLPEHWIVLVRAGFPAPTAAVYGGLDPRLTGPGRGASIRRFLRQDPWGSVRLPRLSNDLEDVALRLHPALRRTLEAVRDSGAEQARVSGSGSSVFGVYASAEDARRAVGGLRSRGITCSRQRFLSRRRYAAFLVREVRDARSRR